MRKFKLEYCLVKVAFCAMQIGQLLLHVRVSTNNRMLPFTMQLIEQISSATLPFSPGCSCPIQSPSLLQMPHNRLLWMLG